jgi:DUF1680 family protein
MFASFTSPESGPVGKTANGKDQFPGLIIENISYQDVKITDHFWRPKIEKNRLAGVRSALKECSQSMENFDVAAGKKKGKHKGNAASDSDVFKVIQGAAYSLHHTPDKELEATVDSLIVRIVAAQQPDGYLFTYWIINDLSQQWTDIPRKHELYCAGHMIEAAVAYYQATGKRNFLDAAIRFANHIDSVFGPHKRLEVPGHAEIELALYQLYQVTHERKYLDLSAFFVNERGDPKRMLVEKITPPDRDPNANTPQRWRPPSYKQDHLPVTEQYYAVGHAVRACYLYSSMADISLETKDSKYLPALDSIWNDVVGKKLYITGGIGTRQFHDEGFGSAYLLPNDQAYCETCANIALTFWNRRMNLLHGEAKYADLVELTMYNSGISGVSLSGDRFFYTNPLESTGKHKREAWDNPPCCPSNMVRFLPEIGSTIYGKRDKDIYVNQFIGSEVNILIGSNKVGLVQESNYPWAGAITMKVKPEAPVAFKLHVRIPGWARGELLPGGLYEYLKDENPKEDVTIKVNGELIRSIQMERGYAVIDRKWKMGDRVELEMPMKVRLVEGNPSIADAKGKVVIMRGPLVFCLEETDNKSYFSDTNNGFQLHSGFRAEYQHELLGGVVSIRGTASLLAQKGGIDITAIPYFAWCNREQGQMKVWLPYKGD